MSNFRIDLSVYEIVGVNDGVRRSMQILCGVLQLLCTLDHKVHSISFISTVLTRVVA